MTSDDRPGDAQNPATDGANRYGTERPLGRDDRSLYGTGAPGAPSSTDRPSETPAEAEGNGTDGTTGFGPRGSGAFVAGASTGVLGAAAPALGAAAMGSGEVRGGMAGSGHAAEGNEASDAPGGVREGPGTETNDGPASGGQAGTGPQTPAV